MNLHVCLRIYLASNIDPGSNLSSNLDPESNHGDLEIWQALEQAQMKEKIESLPSKLSADVTEGGDNFSVGEMQLLCMARVLLRRPKLLVIDEGTSGVDQ